MSRLEDPGALVSFREELQRARQAWPLRLTLSSGTCGEASGSLSVLRALQDELQKRGLTDEVHVRVTGSARVSASRSRCSSSSLWMSSTAGSPPKT